MPIAGRAFKHHADLSRARRQSATGRSGDQIRVDHQPENPRRSASTLPPALLARADSDRIIDRVDFGARNLVHQSAPSCPCRSIRVGRNTHDPPARRIGAVVWTSNCADRYSQRYPGLGTTPGREGTDQRDPGAGDRSEVRSMVCARKLPASDMNWENSAPTRFANQLQPEALPKPARNKNLWCDRSPAGAPRSRKMGTTRSPWRYDAERLPARPNRQACDGLRSCTTPHASAVFPDIVG